MRISSSGLLLRIGTFSLALLLAACGTGSYNSTAGTTSVAVTKPTTGGTTAMPVTFSGASAPNGTKDSILATASVPDPATAAVGTSQTVSIVFNSDDEELISGFGVSNTLGNLPAGWSGPSTFSCAAVAMGSGCVLNLTYTPTTVETGMLAINYVFLDDAGQPKTGYSFHFAYASTANDNVAAMASPTGQVNAVAGKGTQPVIVTFMTDDGNAATDLTVTTDLTALPAGWSSPNALLSCAIISTGNGCQLALAYAPATAAAGTLTLNYGYTDETGASKAGAINIPYAATTVNNVAATVAPNGQVIAVQKTGGQPVAVTFDTDDGAPASGLALTTDLSKLPPGWSSAMDSFSCSSVSTGNGCQLRLTYAPTDLSTGVLTLTYAYEDNSGGARSGSLNIAYAGTTNDNVTNTESPAGQIAAVIGDGSQPGDGSHTVAVTFTTDDGRPATAVTVMSSLATLPPGWTSSVSSLVCPGLNADNACQFSLSYAPTAPGSGTLMLNYSYENNDDQAKTGTITIPYRSTTNDNVRATPSQSSLPSLRTGSGSNPVSISFTTDDGNPASALTITSGLSTLPPDWTSAATTFTCATVSAGAPCVLPLIYTPTVATPAGSMTLGYSYINDAGLPGSGSVSITYSAYTPYLYVVDSGSSAVSACALNFDNSLAACSITGSGFATPLGIALSGNFAYIANNGGNSISRCVLAANGALTSCSATGGTFNAPTGVAVHAAASGTVYAYIGTGAGLTVCAIAVADGSLSGCGDAAAAFEPLANIASSTGPAAYGVHSIANPGPPPITTYELELCTIASNGTLSGCAASGSGVSQPAAALAVQNGYLYASSSAGSLYVCPINGDGTLGSCAPTAVATNADGLAFAAATAASGIRAFLTTGAGSIRSCPVFSDGTLGSGSCTLVSDPSFSGAAAAVLRTP